MLLRNRTRLSHKVSSAVIGKIFMKVLETTTRRLRSKISWQNGLTAAETSLEWQLEELMYEEGQ